MSESAWKSSPMTVHRSSRGSSPNASSTWRTSLFTTSPDPTLSVVHRYKSSTIGNAFANAAGWINEEYDQLTDIEVTITDVDERAAVWKRIQEILMDELPGYPLFGMPNMQLVSSKFADVVMDPLGYNSTFDRAYLKN